ncbi:MAG: HEAT repeat domain-containing protein [Fimbriiglobus sp.]|jgi:HEAT repeat protein|nr:HEAT repeat domain-containing protein [Fimbriiglobus sp.]
MSRIVLAAVAVGLALGASVRADNKENIEAAKAALATLEKTKDAKERAAAIAKLGKVAVAGQFEAAKPGIPKVMDGLNDKDAGVRAAAALAIGQLGPDDADAAIKKLAELLKDKDDTVKSNAVKSLGSFGPKAKSAVKDLQAAKKEIGDPQNRFSREIDAALRTINPKKPK